MKYEILDADHNGQIKDLRSGNEYKSGIAAAAVTTRKILKGTPTYNHG